ncbi:response regulator [Desulfosediminicola ganghwensis]|uniref:hybrid sensor histidine kinase/response regulator n=1 Tax=Desulfosediminicola ganghwensis TaxID=2569540 RepID=UPI0010ABAA99|nr:response regulator [Desulfosediminicola ganghwensis]
MAEMRVLIIDDEEVIREGVQRALSNRGYVIAKAENGEAGIEMIRDQGFDIVLLDLMMPGIDGFGVLEWVKEHQPQIEVIVITGFATVSKAVSAMKQGAFDFVGKPFTPDYIRIVVSRAADKIKLERETHRLREEHTLNIATIQNEQSRLKTVFGCMAEAVVITDNTGVVVHHNPAAIKILEIQTDPVIGKDIAQSILDTNAVEMVHQAMAKQVVVTREFQPGTISRKYLRAHCAPVTSESGRVIGSVTAFEDISTHKEIDRMKSDFVAMVAHELKSPLASVEQMIYALQVGCKYESGQACSTMHKRITVRTRDLLRMIDNLLNLSKMENGTVEFNLEPVRGHEVLDHILDVVREQAENKEITIAYMPSDEDWWFNVDYDHIRTAFMNIISNALKYTPQGGRVEIATTVIGGFANLSVQDSGIGISDEDLPHIFDRFFRVKGKATRHITGSGLGLSLVKEVVEAHQGYIDVHSELGEGTCFTLSFPITEPVKATPEHVAAEAQPG